MKAIGRRRLMCGILCSAVAAAAGLALTSAPSEAMPFDARVAGSLDGMVEKAQVVVVNPSSPSLALLVASRSTRLWLALTPDAGSDPRYPRRAAPIAGLRPTSWATMTRWLRS